MSQYAEALIRIDRQPPMCSESPILLHSQPDGSLKPFAVALDVSDTFDPDPSVAYAGFTSSDGGGNVLNVVVDSDGATGEFRNSKSGLARIYRLKFQTADEAGNTCWCYFNIKVK
jgi:hypothetical protein